MFKIAKILSAKNFNGYIVIIVVMKISIAKIFPSKLSAIFANIFQRKIIPVYSKGYVRNMQFHIEIQISMNLNVMDMKIREQIILSIFRLFCLHRPVATKNLLRYTDT